MKSKIYNLEPDPRVIIGSEGENIYLSILIGNGQVGGNYITLDREVVAKGDLSIMYHLGASDKLKGKIINVQTNVLDVNSFTNKCVITTTFFNENHDVLFKKIDNGEAPEGGIAIFKGNYVLK